MNSDDRTRAQRTRRWQTLVLALVWLALAEELAAEAPSKQGAEPGGDAAALIVPRGSPPALDGTCSHDEWADARIVPVGGDALLAKHDGRFVYLCLRTPTTGNRLGSLCVLRGDEVRVLHASALGTATYRLKEPPELWQLAAPFPPGPNPRTRRFITDEWRCRDSGNSPQASAERAAHLLEEGWLASPVDQGASGEMEYQISRELQGPEPMRLVITSGLRWPPGSEDDCANERLIGGDAPSYLWLDLSSWGEISLSD